MRLAAALALLSISTSVTAFAPCPLVRNTRAVTSSALATGPLDNVFALLKGGKVGLVKSLAGEYDEAAIKTKLDGLIKKNPVLMLSFTT
jgi:hypothetical protein